MLRQTPGSPLWQTRKSASGYVQLWTPKDHERRALPLPPCWAHCPYLFMDGGRRGYYRQQVDSGQWMAGRDLMNNLLRHLQRRCGKAGVGPYTIHDLRRSCITNWVGQLPIHVVQQLAGHSDIKTTEQSCLSVRPEDVARAQQLQSALLGQIPPAPSPTDQKLTKSAAVRCLPKRKVFAGVRQSPER